MARGAHSRDGRRRRAPSRAAAPRRARPAVRRSCCAGRRPRARPRSSPPCAACRWCRRSSARCVRCPARRPSPAPPSRPRAGRSCCAGASCRPHGHSSPPGRRSTGRSRRCDRAACRRSATRGRRRHRWRAARRACRRSRKRGYGSWSGIRCSRGKGNQCGAAGIRPSRSSARRARNGTRGCTPSATIAGKRPARSSSR